MFTVGLSLASAPPCASPEAAPEVPLARRLPGNLKAEGVWGAPRQGGGQQRQVPDLWGEESKSLLTRPSLFLFQGALLD